ncbi:hypothetical protein [Nocardia crassostreae]|uniref:hypothetical protein n=1 Tax=Nocardia crassostreae TaxID=53428 RepID=UPI00082ECB58|nr:hypothetical protein [Nocardia crassostreae]
MSTPAATVLSLVVVLNKVAGRLVIWHVNVGQAVGLSRVSGAWVLEEDEGEAIATLVGGKRIVWCGGEAAVPEWVSTAGVVDVDASVIAMRDEVAVIDGLFSTHQGTVANKLIRPQWPEFVHPREVRQPLHHIDERVRPALLLARGIADLADAWAALESLRLARSFLLDHGGRVARPVPLTVR